MFTGSPCKILPCVYRHGTDSTGSWLRDCNRPISSEKQVAVGGYLRGFALVPRLDQKVAFGEYLFACGCEVKFTRGTALP